MRSGNDLPTSLELTSPTHWASTYQREGHTAWSWFAEGANRSVYPHITVWTDDVNRSGALISFHVTAFYNNESHLPVHVHYTVKDGYAKFKSTDVNRCGAYGETAKAWVNENWRQFDALADEFVKVGIRED